MRIRKLLRVRFVVYSFTEQEKIMAELTPMMQKYMETKEQYKDCILFYRLGDFYPCLLQGLHRSRKRHPT